MLHHAGVKTETTTIKLRVVFDVSSHARGVNSLNAHLEKGPKVNADLVLILLHFRLFKIALTVGIRKAFLQVSVHPDDRVVSLVSVVWDNTNEHEHRTINSGLENDKSTVRNVG